MNKSKGTLLKNITLKGFEMMLNGHKWLIAINDFRSAFYIEKPKKSRRSLPWDKTRPNTLSNSILHARPMTANHQNGSSAARLNH